MKSKLSLKSISGFTLIELLVVIAIIGLLSSVIFASLNSARIKARDAKRISEIVQVKRALELYFDTQGAGINYPSIGADGSGYDLAGLATPLANYMTRIPVDPLGSSWDTYQYVRGSPNSYGIRVRLENGGYCLTGEKINPGWWSVGTLCNF